MPCKQTFVLLHELLSGRWMDVLHLSEQIFMSQRKSTLVRLPETIMINRDTLGFHTVWSFIKWFLNTSYQYEFKLEDKFLNRKTYNLLLRLRNDIGFHSASKWHLPILLKSSNMHISLLFTSYYYIFLLLLMSIQCTAFYCGLLD